MTFQEVEDNANRQYSSCQQIDSEEISGFYPELHTGPMAGVFSNTIGSHLLADVLTSPHVVVDLYNYRNESDLIRAYGVDKVFLLRLRDAGQITICANLLPESFRDSHWLHDVLADHRTIFRSVRTPLYFRRQLPDLKARQDALKADLLAILPTSDADLIRLGRMTNAMRPPESRDALAEILAIWAIRLRAAAGYEAEETISQLQADPESAIVPLRQKDLCAVAPNSAGLGGTVRLTYENLASHFPDQPPSRIPTEVGEGYMRVEALNEFLTRTVLGAPHSSLTSEEYWNRLNEYEREQLFERLSDPAERREAALVEETLRLDLCNSDPGRWTELEIERRARDIAERYRRYLDRVELDIAMSAGYLVHANFEALAHIPIVGPVVTLFLIRASHGMLSASIKSGWLRPIAERLVPKIQLVHFVERHGS